MNRYFVPFFLLIGCLGPHYEPPLVDVPEHWRLPTNEGSTLCNLKWWEQFDDPVLNSFILTGLEYNQDLRLAISRVFEYYARLGAVRAALFPELDGFASYTRNQNSLALPGTAALSPTRIYNDFQADFILSWQLDFWGQVRSATEAAYADLLSQVDARQAVVITVVTSIANGYFTLRSLDAQLQVSQNTLQSRHESLQLAQDRFQEGETSEIEVKQAEAEVEIAAIRLLELQRAIPQQENALSVLLGHYPHDLPRGNSVDAMNYPVTIPAGLPSDLLTQRPDIRREEEKLIAANARVYEAKTYYFPQFNLTGTYGNESLLLHQFLTSPAVFWQIGVNAMQTIFDAGKTYYHVDETMAIRAEILASYRQTIFTAFQEVSDALIAVQKNLELVKEHQRQVKILGEYLFLAQARYEEGEVDYLNVLDAERLLFNAELNLAAAYGDHLTAIVNLYGALGGGWVEDADEMALSPLG